MFAGKEVFLLLAGNIVTIHLMGVRVSTLYLLYTLHFVSYNLNVFLLRLKTFPDSEDDPRRLARLVVEVSSDITYALASYNLLYI